MSHCFEFVLQCYLGDWDRAFEKLPTYLFHRGSGQDVVQENWILKMNVFFFLLKKTNFLFFFSNKMWSFEQPFWKIIVFKNQTILFDYEGSRSLNSCNQNLLLSFEHCQIKSSKAIKKWHVIIFKNHIVGWKQGECSRFGSSFESFWGFENLRNFVLGHIILWGLTILSIFSF